jgi:TonB family protein
MRRLSIFALLCVSVATIASGQQAASSAQSLSADTKPERVKVYAVGPDVTAPELLPLDMAPIAAENCKKNVDGKVVLSVIVDAKGNPRNLMFTKTVNADFDKRAYQIVAADRFKPGMKDGAPVAVAQSVDVDMQDCSEKAEDDHGKKIMEVQWVSRPVQKLEAILQPTEDVVLPLDVTPAEDTYVSAYPLTRNEKGVKLPVVLSDADAEFTDEARKAKFQGTCQVSLIIDPYGMPRQLRVVHPLGMGLDQKAMEAIRQFRFKAAMKNGEPAAMKIAIEVNFRLQDAPSKN